MISFPWSGGQLVIGRGRPTHGSRIQPGEARAVEEHAKIENIFVKELIFVINENVYTFADIESQNQSVDDLYTYISKTPELDSGEHNVAFFIRKQKILNSKSTIKTQDDSDWEEIQN